MGTYTTNYSFFKPEPGVDKNWGLEINTANWDQIDLLIHNLRVDVDNYLIQTGGSFDNRLTNVETVSANNSNNISSNSDSITNNSTAISTNSSNISQNAADIVSLQNKDSDLQGQITTNLNSINANSTTISNNRADFLAEHKTNGEHSNINCDTLEVGIGVNAYEFPNADGLPNQILVTNGAGTLIWMNDSDLETDTLQSVSDRGGTSTVVCQFINGIELGNGATSYILPSTIGSADQVLVSDGSSVTWKTISGATNTLDDVCGNGSSTTQSITVAGLTIDDGSNPSITFPTQDSTAGYWLATDGAGNITFTANIASNVSIIDAGGIITATEVEGALQEIKTLTDANTTHRTSNGSDHTYIDQDVTSGSSPTFDGANITGVDAVNVDIADSGNIIVATNVEGALQENRSAIDLNTNHRNGSGSDHSDVALNNTHRTSDGSDHSFINQSVVIGASPSFVGTNITGLVASYVNITDAGNIITATEVEGALQENRTAIDLNTTHRTGSGSDHTDVAANTAARHSRSHSITSTSDHTANNWSVFYSNGSGEVIELGLGSSGQVLTSNGNSAAPTFETPSSGFSDPMTTRGDIIIRDATNTTTRLGIGTSGQVLKSDGVDISWQDETDTLDIVTGRGSITSNSIQIGGLNLAGNYSFPTVDGTNGQVLKTDGSGSLSWQDESGGFADPMTTRGDIIIRDNTNTTTRLGVGTSGQVLTSDGIDVSWSDPATAAYTTSFTNSDLSSGQLTVTHNLNTQFVLTVVYDNNNKQIIPDEVIATSTSACTIDLSSYGTISGTWNVRVI